MNHSNYSDQPEITPLNTQKGDGEGDEGAEKPIPIPTVLDLPVLRITTFDEKVEIGGDKRGAIREVLDIGLEMPWVPIDRPDHRPS